MQAYCHKRKAERNFLTRSIETVKEIDKKRTTIKFGKPKTKFLENQSKKDEDVSSGYKSKKNIKENVVHETIREVESSSQTPVWLYIIIAVIVMGLARGFLIPLMD